MLKKFRGDAKPANVKRLPVYGNFQRKQFLFIYILIWKGLIDNHYQLVIFGRNRDKIAFLLQGRAQNLRRLGKVEQLYWY